MSSGRRYSFFKPDAPVAAGNKRTACLRRAPSLCLGVSAGKYFKRASFSRESTACNICLMRSGAVPAFGRIQSRNHDQPGLLMACAFIMAGRKTSVAAPGSVPVKPFGATPTISNCVAPIRNLFPIALGSPAKRLLQKS